MNSRRVLAALVAVLALSGPSSAGDKTTLVVLNFQVGKGIEQQTAKLLNDLMLSEFQKAGLFRVFGEQDIVSMMSLEQTRVETTGCADNACLAEIGGALGAQYLVASSVGMVGERYLLNMKLIDVKRADAIGRSSQITEGKEHSILAAIKLAVREVLSAITGEPAAGPSPAPGTTDDGEVGAGAADSTTTSSRSLAWDVGAWGAGGLALALVASATASAVLASQSYDDMEATPVVDSGHRSGLEDETRTRALAADVLFGLAGAAAVTSVVLFLLMPEDSPAATVGAAPVAGGAAITIGGHLPGRGW